MRQELTGVGFSELKNTQEVDNAFNNTTGTMLLMVNSVCGCAAGSARPAVRLALKRSEVKPDAFPERCQVGRGPLPQLVVAGKGLAARLAQPILVEANLWRVLRCHGDKVSRCTGWLAISHECAKVESWKPGPPAAK